MRTKQYAQNRLTVDTQHSRLYQLFKYAVYALLAFNVYAFFAEDWAAVPHRFANGIAVADIIEGFAQSIDTAAWLVLLLMFELETHVLADHHFTRRVTLALHGLRAVCYGFIVYAFYGYVTKLLFLFGIASAPEIASLCALAADNWAYAIDLDEYTAITAGNCSSFPSAAAYFRFPEMHAVVDAAGRTEIVRLAWADVINAGVWLLVVLVLEIDVRLQDRGLLEGAALRISNVCKTIFYSILLLAAVYWGVKGDFVDFWDAFLWLVAFAFIERNVVEWRRESSLQQAAAAA